MIELIQVKNYNMNMIHNISCYTYCTGGEETGDWGIVVGAWEGGYSFSVGWGCD